MYNIEFVQTKVVFANTKYTPFLDCEEFQDLNMKLQK